MAIRLGFASKIESVEYFYAAEKDAAKAKALGVGVGELDANGERRDYVQYLSGGDNDARAGELLVLERKGDPSSTPSPQFSFLSPLSGLKTGAVARGALMRDLCAGKDPDTGAVALAGKKHKGVVKPAGGFDCQIGVVKSVSLAVVFDKGRGEGIRAAEKGAYFEAMQWAFDNGLFATRVTVDNKIFYEPARKMVMAVYTHATSRAEDPHDHHHGAVMAMCERQDGTLGTMSNFLLMRYGGAINAYKKCAEAAALKKLGLAVEIDPDNPRAYRLAGVEPRLGELFSKRREQIEAAAKKAGVDTATDRLAAQLIAYDTRADKRFTEAETLEAKWEAELKAAGYTRESFVYALEAAAREQAKARPVETDDARRGRLSGLVMGALGELQRDSAVFSRATLFRTAFEALQCEVESGAEAAALVAELEKRGELVLLADRGGDPIYTTAAMIDMEKATLRAAWGGKGKGPQIDPASVEAVLEREDNRLKQEARSRAEAFEYRAIMADESRRKGLTISDIAALVAEAGDKAHAEAGIKPEQKKAVRHALSGDQFTATQGYAGTGKSFITALQREIVEAQGYRVFGTAPSWKATDVLKNDSGLKLENCVVLAKLLYDHRQAKQKGESLFDVKSFIILDEAGMVSARDMAELVEIARETGASLRLQGDKGQFRAVDAGAPFAAIQRLLGAAELRDIQRQQVKWMCEASVELDDANNSADEQKAVSGIKHALQGYDDQGRVAWVDTDEEAFAAAVEKVMEWRAAHPADSCAVVTEWNANAREASAILRSRLKEAGQIDAEDTALRVMVRGAKENTKGATLDFAKGDEIIFGENVKLPERTIRNNDLARLMALDAADPENPRFRFRFEDGQEVEATYRELVGRREEGELAAPRMQYSYVMTAHSSQGATYARTVDLSLEGHGREAALVMSTRHKFDHFKVVSTERLSDQIDSKKAVKLALGKDGRILNTAEDDDAATARAELEEIKAVYYKECAGHDSFGNVSDFYADIHEFAGVENLVPKRAEGIPAPMPPELLKNRAAAIFRNDAAKPCRPQWNAEAAARLSWNKPQTAPARPAAQGGAVAALVLSDSGTAAMQAVARYAPPTPAAPTPPQTGYKPFAKTAKAEKFAADKAQYGSDFRPRVSKEELSRILKVDILTFAEQKLGGTVLEKWAGGGMIDVPGVGHVGTGIAESGDCVWSRKQGGDGGNLVNLLQVAKFGYDKEGFGRAIHWVANELKIYDPDRPVTVVAEKKTQEQKKAAVARRGQIINWFENLAKNPVSRWLTDKRGIAAATIAKFSASIRGEGESEKARNRYGVAFAHFDGDLKLTTLARRGPQGFNRYAEGGERSLFQAGAMESPARAYISETSIDTLSVYQIDGSLACAALLATDGSLSEAAREIIVRRAREWPDTVWHVAQDNDEPRTDKATGEVYVHGHRHRDAVIEAIREGNPSAKIEVRDPGEDFKDFNDTLRGPEFSKSAQVAKEALEGDRAKEREAEAERLRQLAEAEAAASRPKMR